MLVRMHTTTQAARVAGLTGWAQLPGKPDKNGACSGEDTKPGRLVDAGGGFETQRAAVESVSVLFELFDGIAVDYLDSGVVGEPLPSGWMVTAAKFEVECPTDRTRCSLVNSHFGGRRFAYNWGLARVKADIDARKHDPAHESVAWNLAALRKAWNVEKGAIAPWWEANSKETYSSGLDDLVTALGNWSASKKGLRKGRTVGFPRFRSRSRDSGRVRFTTGTMRLEPDRRGITLPVLGTLRSKENTRRVQRHTASGRARILNMTMSEQWGRLFVSVNYALRTPETASTPAQPTTRAGVDVGIRMHKNALGDGTVVHRRTLATVVVRDLVTSEETVTEYTAPAALHAVLGGIRRANRELSRRIPGSRGYLAAKTKLTRSSRRAVNVRQESVHQLTSWLTATYGEIVVEDLDLASMKKGMGRRAFRRSVSDAGLGAIRPQLAYKANRTGAVVTVADRWFPSSQLHRGHALPDGTYCRLVGKGRIDKHLTCPSTGEVVDRDHNAGGNLCDWPDQASAVQLEPRPRTSALPPAVAGTSAQPSRKAKLGRTRKTTPQGKAASSEVRTERRSPTQGTAARNPARGAA